jgi:uncharacterized Fe-S cluster protein YjdI
MDKTTVIKEYSNGEITVLWQAAMCQHSANCVRHLATVFQPKQHPWIKIDNASSKEIIETVAKCPSGALSIKQVEK